MTGADAWIRDAAPGDAVAIAAIYNHYVERTVVTFEEEPVSPDEMARRIAEIAAVPLPWLVAESAGVVVGYAYASRWKPRSGYRHAAEVTVYLDPRHVGRRLGARLYGELFSRLRSLGKHAVVGGIALPNPASVALHEKFGMVQVALFREQGRKFERWIDVGYWQATL